MSRLVRQVHTVVCLYLLLYCAGAFVAPAQQFRGALRGVVQDASGGRVPAAKIFVFAAESSLQREIASDSRIDDLLPGIYRVKFQASGFAEANTLLTFTTSSGSTVLITRSATAAHQ